MKEKMLLKIEKDVREINSAISHCVDSSQSCKGCPLANRKIPCLEDMLERGQKILKVVIKTIDNVKENSQ